MSSRIFAAALVTMMASIGAQAADQSIYVQSEGAKAAKLPFSDAVQVGNVLYLSGQVGNVPGSAKLVEGGFAPEAKQAMDNIGAVLKRSGLTYDDLFKCTVFLADIKTWPDFNKIYVGYFKPERMPARSAFATNGLALSAAVEVECWANTAH